MNARPNAAHATSASSATSAYIRASCAKRVRNGFVAISTAAIHPAREPNSVRAAHHATGTAISAHSTENQRVASSDVPATAIQTCISM